MERDGPHRDRIWIRIWPPALQWRAARVVQRTVQYAVVRDRPKRSCRVRQAPPAPDHANRDDVAAAPYREAFRFTSWMRQSSGPRWEHRPLHRLGVEHPIVNRAGAAPRLRQRRALLWRSLPLGAVGRGVATEEVNHSTDRNDRRPRAWCARKIRLLPPPARMWHSARSSDSTRRPIPRLRPQRSDQVRNRSTFGLMPQSAPPMLDSHKQDTLKQDFCLRRVR